jgi:hypothetical protein
MFYKPFTHIGPVSHDKHFAYGSPHGQLFLQAPMGRGPGTFTRARMGTDGI